MTREETQTENGPRLPVGYYLANFELALDTVLQRDATLFDNRETNRFEIFRSTPLVARRLAVRLFTRLPGWHRVSQLNYDEIPDTRGVCELLRERDLLLAYDGSGDMLSEISNRLRAAECRLLLKEAGIHPKGKVADLRSQVVCGVDSDRLLALDSFVRLVDRDLYRRVMLLFFANRRQNLSDFVVRDIGNLRYEHITLSSLRLFDRREHAVNCLSWADWRDDVFAAYEDGNERALEEAAETALENIESYHFDGCSDRGRALLMRPLVTLIRNAAAGLERGGRYEEAISMYLRLLACDIRGEARNHATQCLLIDLEKDRRKTQALRTTERALAEVTDPVFKHDLNKRRARLARRTKCYAQPAPKLMKPAEVRFRAVRLPTEAGIRHRFVSGSDEASLVEKTALRCYSEAYGYQGAHVENALPGALMAACFWDIIYMAAPGAFLHEFQSGPLDWGGASFYHERERPIRDRLKEIRQDGHRERAMGVLSDKAGIVNPLFSWNSISPDIIERTLQVWPGPSLAPCLEAMVKNANGWGRGFPDLILFDCSGGFVITEVKGPGDKVADAQALWFDLLLRNNVRVELCHIEADPI
ncbi:MAG: VRR-NUC domain-containing protein [Gammaproteobacteria bacterium]|mgnify:CR=1 FL=1|nr:VRR-NUC domain-containing protein [Gammaproteobacteria bacterium]